MTLPPRRRLRVVVTGSECTGKTTLAAELAKRYGTAWAREGSRSYAERVKRQLGAGDIEPIAFAQIVSEGHAEVEVRGGLLVLDTDLVSTVVYARHYYNACPAWIESTARTRRACLYLLLHPDVPWVPDGIRDRPQQRDEIHALFAKTLTRFDANVVDVRGGWDARRATAVAAVDALLAARPDAPRN